MTSPTDEAARLLETRLGLEFPTRRRDDLEHALLACAGPDGPRALLARLATRPTSDPAWTELIHGLTVRESYFFRDPALFTALRTRVLPELLARRGKRLVIWSAGCATGEEPYSLAILVRELLPAGDVTIVATDLDATALDAARRGVFTKWALRETPTWVRDRSLRPLAADRYELDAEIRAMVDFAPLNLAADAFPAAVDLIVCRNVLMYFTPEARRNAVARLTRSLAPGGWLALSPLDLSLDAHPELEPVEVEDCRLHRPRTAIPERVPAAVEPPDPPALLEGARSAADRGRLEAARTLCRHALDVDPLDLDAYLLLSAIEDERGDAGAAIDALRRAIYTAPDSATAHFRLGGLLLRTGARGPGRRSLETAAGLLGAQLPGTPVPGAGGATAGTLLTAARAHLEGAS